jgi:hypothetical protein
MASNKILRMGPVAMGTTAANIVNPPTLTGGTGLANTNSNTYIILRHIRIVNKNASAVTATLYVGATGGSAAGTEFGFNATQIPANSYVDWYGMLRLEPADFLTGLAGTATSLTFEAEGEIGIV